MKGRAPRPDPAPGRLRPELAARVAVVARLAAGMRMEAWLVGGTVRDLLLGRGSPDLDFVVVGDGLGLAVAVHGELGGRLLRHPEFLTVDIIDAAGIHLDIATARQESYPEIAALPAVRPAAAIEEDLWRRDFAVNAIALRLTPGEGSGLSGAGGGEAGGAIGLEAPDGLTGMADLAAGGRIADPTGGLRDVAAAALRVLHPRSFLDDPTRVLRGVRFEARLGFRMTPETEELAREAVAAGAFDRLSGGRLRHELELLLGAEPAPAAALAGLERLQELGALGAVHPRLALDAAARRRLLDAAAEHAWYRAFGASGAAGLRNVASAETAAATAGGETEDAFTLAAAGRMQATVGPAALGAGGSHRSRPAARPWLLLLMALAAGLDEVERGELGARLLLAGDALRLLSGFGGRLAGALPRLAAGALPHEVDAALAGLEEEELLLLAAASGTLARSWVRRYLTEMRPLALGIGGDELLAAGARRGPAIGRALRATRAARLDGEIGPGEELDYALSRLREPPDENGADR